MFKKILAIGALVLSVSVSVTTAKAQTSRVYFASYLGLNTSNDQEFSESSVPQGGDFEYKNAGSFAGALGLRISPQLRLEGEVSYRNADLSSVDFNNNGTFDMGGNMRTYLFMLNAYYDFDLEWEKISPFVSAGFGLAYHDGEIDDSSGFATDATASDMGFVYQVGGGLKYRWDENLAFSGGYRYIGGSDISIDTYDIDYSNHEIRFGLEYDLPVDFLQ